MAGFKDPTGQGPLQKRILKDYIFEYYIYDFIKCPIKLDSIKNIIFYPELLLTEYKQNKPIKEYEYVSFPSYVLEDYLERYLPTYFSNEYKFYSYNETLKYSLKHSIL